MTLRWLLLVIWVVGSAAMALEQGESRFKGYGTAGLTRLGGEDMAYGIHGQTTDHWRGDQLSRLGGQWQYGISDNLEFTAQALAKAEQDSWQVEPEWLYLSWQPPWQRNLQLRGGRLEAPIYLYSDTLNVGLSYPWLRLPEEVYDLIALNNYEGGELLYWQPLAFGNLRLQAGFGQAEGREVFRLNQLQDIDFHDAFIANALLATQAFGTFRLGYTEARVVARIKSDFVDQSGIPRQIDQHLGFSGTFVSLGHHYEGENWLSAAEVVTLRTSGADAELDSDNDDASAFYLMAGRRLERYLAHVTYGQRDRGDGHQRSLTYALNYQLSPRVVLKGEFKRVDVAHPHYYGVFNPSAQRIHDDALQGDGGAPDGDIFSFGVDFIF